jgi:ATP-binding protein involved in chromosome partitioning
MGTSVENKPEWTSCDGRCNSCDGRNACPDPRALQYETSKRMEKIKHKILIGSGKGGVGKSTVVVNLAMAFHQHGYKVGILDADITGPDIPKLMGIEDRLLRGSAEGIEPANAQGIKVISMALLLKDRDAPIVWRGPMKMAAIKQFISEVNWGDLDYLVIDLPPGTSDEPLSVAQLIPNIDGAIVVTTPQEVALLDSRKAVNMFKALEVSVLGIIENMSGLRCPHCGEMIEVFKHGDGENAAKELGVNFLGSIPIDIDIVRLGDLGEAFIDRDVLARESFEKITSRIIDEISCKEIALPSVSV